MQKRDGSGKVDHITLQVVEKRDCGWSCADPNQLTIILQSSVGTPEGHSEVGPRRVLSLCLRS